MQYEQYLHSPQWQRLRREAMERAGHKCEFCGKGAMAVHHVKYPKNGYEHDSLENLVVVCKRCHSLVHGIRENGEERIKQLERLLEMALKRIAELENRFNGTHRGPRVTLQQPRLDTRRSPSSNPYPWGVLGFSLTQKTMKGYTYWCAFKKISGKVAWVYVGSDPAKAEAKIQAWMERRQGK